VEHLIRILIEHRIYVNRPDAIKKQGGFKRILYNFTLTK